MRHIFLLAMISAVTLTGCATRLTGGVDVLNQRIAYLGLDKKNCWKDDDPESKRKCQIEVRAGMRIRLDSIALPSADSKKFEQQTLPSSYTYTVPDVDRTLADGLVLGRENAFFITSLLSMAEQVDDDLAVWQLMYSEDSDSDTYASRVTATPGSYADRILKPFLESMRIDYEFKEKNGLQRTTAQLAKRVFCSADGLDHTLEISRTLQATLPPGKDGERVIELGSDNWFYTKQVGNIGEKRLSEFMKLGSTVRRARANIELSIAVRLDSEEGARYVAPCTTIADMERIFGVEIVGIWREHSNLAMKGNEGDATADKLITLGWHDKSTVNPDGYYSIELRPGAEAAPGGTLIDGTGLCGKKNPCLEKVLLAHGDVLLVGRRQHVLGSFWQQ